jgi:hypothetical protein
MSYAKPDDDRNQTEHSGLPPGANPPALRRAAAVVAALAGVALLAAACGGGGTSATSPSGSQGGSDSVDTTSGVAYTQCMRAHGVPNFPDPSPNANGKPFTGQSLQQAGVDPSSPQFQPASQACQHLMPASSMSPQQRQQVLSESLRYAACMRAHGVPNFPDPGTTSGGSVSFDIQPSIVDTPQFASAARACQSVDPGLALPTNLGKAK